MSSMKSLVIINLLTCQPISNRDKQRIHKKSVDMISMPQKICDVICKAVNNQVLTDDLFTQVTGYEHWCDM